MNQQAHQYVKWYVKERIFPDGGSVLNVSIDPSDLVKLKCNSYGQVKLQICKRKEPGQHGETHYIKVDTYVPQGMENEYIYNHKLNWSNQADQQNPQIPVDDQLPF